MARSQAPVWTAAQLYDLFILGLHWASYDAKKPVRPAVGIFYSFKLCGMMTEKQRKKIGTNYELVMLFENNYTERVPTDQVSNIGVTLAQASCHVVTLLPSNTLLNRAKYFGPAGYQHGITPHGWAYATSITSQYSEIGITSELFYGGWQSYVDSLRRIWGHGEAGSDVL